MKNPRNPEVIPATPDIDTADLEIEAAKAVENAPPAMVAKPEVAPISTSIKAPIRERKFSFMMGLLTLLALILSAALAYYFFFASTTVQVVLHSDPPGATVVLDGNEVGISPVTVEVKPGTHTVIFLQSGFQPFQQTIEVAFDGTVIQQKLIPLTPHP